MKQQFPLKNICSVNVKNQYPNDCKLNIKLFSKYAFVNSKCTDKKVLQKLQDLHFNLVFVAQGYCGCSILKVDEHSFITSDPSIIKASKNLPLDVLEIPPGEILLPGYDTGFIGGCGFCNDQFVFLNGDLKYHSNGKQIMDFIKQHNKKTISIYNGPLLDIGGFICVEN